MILWIFVMKMKILRISYVLIVSLSLLTLSQETFAEITSTAFKGVTQHFKKGFEFFSPTIGKAALDSGFIHNLRFYGSVKRVGDEYIKDSGLDGISKLTKILFPSPAGHLAVETLAPNNFAQYVRDTKTVAHLHNFTHETRCYLEKDRQLIQENKLQNESRTELLQQLKSLQVEIATLKKNHKENSKIKTPTAENANGALKEKEELKTNLAKQLKEANDSIQAELKENKKNFDNYKASITNSIIESLVLKKNNEDKIIKETIEGITNSIVSSLSEEEKDIYPSHTTEQILSAFFCCKFNTQQDIWHLLGNMDEKIVDKTNLPKTDDYLAQDDLRKISSKTDAYDHDDLFALAESDIWTALTPYRPGISPLSNGTTYYYNRAKDEYDKGNTFADCVEMAYRHIINMISYDNVKGEFDLTEIRKIAKNSPYFKNFEEFYERQTPRLANAGNIEMRSLWNSVVGDLNTPQDSLKIIYNREGANEIRSGFINFVRTFQKIFGLTLKDLPQKDLSSKIEWLEESIMTIFKAINSTKTYSFDLSDLIEKDNDLSGNIKITVVDAKTRKGYCFTFYGEPGVHSAISNLTVLNKVEEEDFTENLKTHANMIQSGTTDDTLWLVTNKDTLIKDKVNHPLHLMFTMPLEDNDSKIKLLKTINENFESWRKSYLSNQKNLNTFKVMLGNTLNDIYWYDQATIKKISPQIVLLLEKDDLQDTLSGSVKAIKLDSTTGAANVIQKLKNLDTLHLSKVTDIKDLSFLKSTHDKLEAINLRGSSIETLNGIEMFPNLKDLYVSSTRNIESIVHLNDHNVIKYLDLGGSAINNIDDLCIPNLEELYLSNTISLKYLSFKQPHLKLHTIDLIGSGVSTVNNLGNCPNLEEFCIANSDGWPKSKLTSISLNGSLDKLTKLDLNAAEDLLTISGLNCPNAEKILLNSKKLETLSFKYPMPGLKIIDTWGQGLTKILGLDNCLNLEEVRIVNANLQALPVKQIHEYLKVIIASNLRRSKTSIFQEILDKSPNLNVISMGGVGRQPPKDNFHRVHRSPISHMKKTPKHIVENLSFNSSRNSLTNISITYSDLEDIEGLEHCSNLEVLNLQGSIIPKLSIGTPLNKLAEISFYCARKLSSLEGLDNCPNLKKLNLEEGGGRSLKTITFEKDNKDLVIKGIRKNQITGMNHLDESRFF